MQNTTNTDWQYDKVVQGCREIFLKKTMDYGPSWRVLRTISIVDQLFIKAQRIRTLQEKRQQRIEDGIPSEFCGIVNYGIIGLIHLQMGEKSTEVWTLEEISRMYDENITFAKSTMMDKNHDYGEAWREMSQESFVDLILMKLHRVRQIIQNEGKTLISEGIDANLTDMINYSVFALILIEDGKH
jgi:hypothetical protein